jgi:hypothetical protein
MTAPVSIHEGTRRRVLAEAYAFALSVARRESTPEKPTKDAAVKIADAETAGDHR